MRINQESNVTETFIKMFQRKAVLELNTLKVAPPQFGGRVREKCGCLTLHHLKCAPLALLRVSRTNNKTNDVVLMFKNKSTQTEL